MSRSFVSDMAARLNGAAHDLAPRLLPHGRRDGRYWRAGDATGAAGNSLFLHLAGPRTGRWQDMATGEGGDMLDLIRHQNRCTPLEAARIGAEMLGDAAAGSEGSVAAADPARMSEQPREQAPDMTAMARRLWEMSAPIGGTLGETYLVSRGIDAGTIAGCADMRFLAEARVRDGDQGLVLPALVTAVRDAGGALTGLHRTFLASDGSGKAAISNPKRALGRLSEAGAWLAPAGRCLVVAEGIETALSVKAAFPGIALVAGLTAPHMALLDIPARFTRILIAADPDVAGLRAAARLANRLLTEGRPARIVSPDPRQGDFNDLLRSGGVAAVRELVRAQLKSS